MPNENDTCPECGGSNKCHWCSPKGSGENQQGGECQMCNGTGICRFKIRNLLCRFGILKR